MLWMRCRIALLISVFGAVVFVLGKVSLFKSSQLPQPAEIQLPEAIPLNGWQATASHELTDEHSIKMNYLAGREYSYRQNTHTLIIQAHYVVNTNGDVKSFIADTLAPSAPDMQDWETQTIQGVGSFVFSDTQESLQLGTCVNPYGGSTVSIEEYKHNRNFQDIRHRLVPWLLGEQLKDERCLWTHILMYSKSKAVSVDNRELIKSAWIDWVKWWSVQLPEIGR